MYWNHKDRHKNMEICLNHKYRHINMEIILSKELKTQKVKYSMYLLISEY